MPGLLVGLLLLLTADPKERTPIAIEHQLMIVEKQPVKISIVSSDPKSNSSALFKVWMKIRHFFHPDLSDFITEKRTWIFPFWLLRPPGPSMYLNN